MKLKSGYSKLVIGAVIAASILFISCKKEKIPTLTTSPITNIKRNSAISGGNIEFDGGAIVTVRGVCWSTTANPSSSDSKTTDGSGTGSFVSNLTGLQPNTTYYVRSYATNSAGTSYGNELPFTTTSDNPTGNQIIADHTIVADYDKIPAYYLAEVKKMMVYFMGESHSEAYRVGLELLEASIPAFACNVATGESYTNQYLRVNSGREVGEAIWFTWYAYSLGARPDAKDFVKNYITDYQTNGHPISVLGFAWCWDMTGGTPSLKADEIYGCRWLGRSDGGPDGNICWGLDEADHSITGNSVCLDTYLNSTQDYIQFCKTNSYATKIVFSTGTVEEFAGEYGYQGYLKNERIRNYVKSDQTRILFDYADILCYDDNGTPGTRTWNGHVYPFITTTNLGDASLGHIGSAGAIRLAKAQWWLLARIAGWDGK